METSAVSNRAVCHGNQNNDGDLHKSPDMYAEQTYPLICRDKAVQLYKGSHFTPKTPTLRAVLKNGDCNIHQTSVPRKSFLQDLFVTLVDLKWRWTLAIFVLGFFISWAIFGVAWLLLAYIHGDLEEHHLPWNQITSNWTPCVTELHDYASAFLFSVETQITTGYGTRSPTDECKTAIFLMCFQNIVGYIIEAFLVGTVFAKMTRPKLRTKTLRFSKYAVICMREGTLCLMFRIGDMRKSSRIIEAKVKTQLIRPKQTKEGETFCTYHTKISVSVDDCDGDLFLIWPMTFVHKIDPSSPFYHLSANDLLTQKFEIVVILEGTIESTDQKTQARSSYLASEVLWGHRFESMISVDLDKEGYRIDHSRFDKVVPVDTPVVSAFQLSEIMMVTEKRNEEVNTVS
ncbi:unnamed protein product [Acanthoscelides obtectus]|nr:unnamed protein product [Acanthoscelides obtectus]CAK1664770.1 Inward rectifier potassium channel 2 [Acanthoscelides obtectus]